MCVVLVDGGNFTFDFIYFCFALIFFFYQNYVLF